jgi:ketosteroid isomerase-like protein
MSNESNERNLAISPEDLTRLFVERANAGDAEGLAALYELDAVVAFPPGQMTVGRPAIQALYERMLEAKPRFKLEKSLPTLRSGDIALTSTPALDEAGARAQLVRRQPDGTWLRVLDRPDFRG